jgi:hypothetical protein
MIMLTRFFVPESTWHYLSEVRPLQESISMLPIRDRVRRASQASLAYVKNNIQGSEEDWYGKGKLPCSEIELHAIKEGFVAIESLWRDISMGTDQVSSNLLTTIHKELGEIGSELFRRIFLSKILPAQVWKALLFTWSD